MSVTDGTDPIEGATVTLIDSEEEEYTGTTGSAGGCTIKDVPEGTYTVTATATGTIIIRATSQDSNYSDVYGELEVQIV